MITEIAELSRWQFAITAMYHFIFVPLTLGLSFMLAIMESCYVFTGKEVYRDMTKFWGKLFGINFAIGVATGLTMEFQFGTNWSYYSHYVGDIFGAPLAIEGLMAFFLESTFVGMFFFGWDRLSKRQHLLSTWLVAFGSNFSALWILVANGWMQVPTGSEFNFESMRMEMTSFSELVLNQTAQVKFAHTVFGGYSTGAMFILAISGYYILKNRDLEFAKRSFLIASVFGFIATVATALLGDESGYDIGKTQPMKLAAMEAEWHTEDAPAPFNVLVITNEETMENDYALQIPYLGGIIATRSISKPIVGMKDLMHVNEERIRNGIKALTLMSKLRAQKPEQRDPVEIARFATIKDDVGYGLLVKSYRDDVENASEEEIKAAARDTVPQVAPLFWTFRIMIAAGSAMIFVFLIGIIQAVRRKLDGSVWVPRLALISLPLPWICVECGWFVAEYGRQPWTVTDILPVDVAASLLDKSDLIFSLLVIVVLYTLFFIAEMYLMIRIGKKGPSSLKTGKYHFEQSNTIETANE